MKHVFTFIIFVFINLSQEVYTDTGTNTGVATGIYYSSGKIGIGKSGPLYNLDVDGTIGFNSTLFFRYTGSGWAKALELYRDGTLKGKLALDASDNLVLSSDIASDLILRTDQTERFRISSNGKVSIGGLNSGALLEVGEWSTLPGSVVISGRGNADGDEFSPLYLGSRMPGIQATTAIVAYQDGADVDYMGLKFKVHTSGTPSDLPVDAMVINRVGKVGIGVNNPLASLQVGATLTSGNFSQLTSMYYSSPKMLVTYSSNRTDWNTPGSPTNIATGLSIHNDDETDGNYSLINFTTRNSATSYAGIVSGMIGTQIFARSSTNANLLGDLVFHTRYGGALPERMRITNTGRIGIGTNNPQTSLHLASATPIIRLDSGEDGVWNMSVSSNNFKIGRYHSSGGVNPFILTSQGYFGFGLGSSGTPAAQVHIKSIDQTTLVVEAGSTASPDVLQLRSNAASNGDLMTVTHDGKVGIGGSLPAEKLDVNGRIRSNQSIDVSGMSNPSGAATMNLAYDSSSDVGLLRSRNWGLAQWKPIHYQALEHIFENGNVGIGTTSTPSEKLEVNGNIRTKKVIVTQDGWSDFVFADDYKLMSLSETEKYIKENKHLPNIPSQAVVVAKGLDIGDMQSKLLQKIEELTLHMIELNKENQNLKERLIKLENRN